MRTRLVLLLLLAAMAGVSGYAIAHRSFGGTPHSSVDRLRDVAYLTRELNLSDAQADKLKRLHSALGDRLADSCTRHCAARARLGQAVAAETNGTMHAEAALTEMCLAYEQSERGALAHIRAVHALLNNEQRRRFEEMISECLCRPCNRQGCACMAEAGTVVP